MKHEKIIIIMGRLHRGRSSRCKPRSFHGQEGKEAANAAEYRGISG